MRRLIRKRKALREQKKTITKQEIKRIDDRSMQWIIKIQCGGR